MARSSIRQQLRGLRQAKNKVNLLPEERMVAMKNPKEAGNTFSGVIDDIGAHHEKKESLTEEVLEHLQEARDAVEKIIEKLLSKL